MAKQDLSGITVAIVLTNDFEQVEMTEPRKALEEAGADIVLIAPKSGEVQGMNHDKMADKFKVDMTLDEAKPEDFDAVLLPGGAINADTLRVEEKAQQFVQSMDEEGKPIAFICHAPWLLVSAKLVKGRTLTCYQTIKDDIVNAGGNYRDEECVRDRNWVSSRQPKDIPACNKEMIKLFSEHAVNA